MPHKYDIIFPKTKIFGCVLSRQWSGESISSWPMRSQMLWYEKWSRRASLPPPLYYVYSTNHVNATLLHSATCKFLSHKDQRTIVPPFTGLLGVVEKSTINNGHVKWRHSFTMSIVFPIINFLCSTKLWQVFSLLK